MIDTSWEDVVSFLSIPNEQKDFWLCGWIAEWDKSVIFFLSEITLKSDDLLSLKPSV